MFGEDFFKIIQFAMAVLRLFGRIFGDKDDLDKDDEIFNHNSGPVEKLIKSNGNNKPPKAA